VNWIQLSNTNIGSGTITSLGVSATPPNRLFYGTVDGRVFRLDSANVGNPVPTNVTASNFPAGAYVNCLAVDPSNANRCIAVFSNYSVVSLFYTTDAGTNWTDISGNLEQNPDGSGSGPSCRWASIVPEVGYFVGTSTGLYSTGALNGALTVWAQEGSTIVGNVVVDMMDARISDGVIVAATHGNGMYSATVGFVLQQYVIRKGWNMISIPVTSNYHTKSKLFPTAISNGFTYHGSYVQTDTFTNGPGYWLKFNNPQSVLVGGALRTHDTVNVAPGWNMIGSISSAVAVSGIASDPRGMVTSGFYGYDSMYTSRDTIHSGHAYWVKVDQSGQLILSASGPASNLLNIGIKGELPPEPPDDKTSDPTAGIPTHFGVDQNYPNPFNPITHFGYRITEVGLVSLRVFDVLGREVATLVNEVKQPGSYTVEFGAGNLASGIYFYRLQTGSGAQIRKMVLVR